MGYKIETHARCAVIGYGSWATALVKILHENEQRVGWYIRNGEVLEHIRRYKTNPRYLRDVHFDTERLWLSDDLNRIVEDSDLLVVNKPQGMTVHPAVGNYRGTLVNALLFHLKNLSGINGAIRPGIVHRLDKNTSGLLVVAKNDAAHLSLSRQIADKTCSRIYRALVDGIVKEDEGVIATQIGRSPSDRKKMAVVKDGKPAVTHFRVLERFREYTYMEFRLETGRTHQIRVHCKYLHHPIVGDDVYNTNKCRFALKGQLLHAFQLGFLHPASGERMEFFAPLPDYFEKILNRLR